MTGGYDWFIDENEDVQERVARGEIRGLQQMVLEAMQNRFPSLVEQAREKASHINDPANLRQLVIQIFAAPDEATARWVLQTFTKQ